MEISLKDGQVEVKITKEGSRNTVQTNIEGGVSDGMWHTVSVHLQGKAEDKNKYVIAQPSFP